MDRIQKIIQYLQDQPQDSFLNHALALEYIKINELPKAQEIFIKILERDPNYIGSYYHLAKLLENINQTELAIEYYQKGMEIAKKIKDQHAYNELQSAFEELTY